MDYKATGEEEEIQQGMTIRYYAKQIEAIQGEECQ